MLPILTENSYFLQFPWVELKTSLSLERNRLLQLSARDNFALSWLQWPDVSGNENRTQLENRRFFGFLRTQLFGADKIPNLNKEKDHSGKQANILGQQENIIPNLLISWFSDFLVFSSSYLSCVWVYVIWSSWGVIMTLYQIQSRYIFE